MPYPTLAVGDLVLYLSDSGVLVPATCVTASGSTAGLTILANPVGFIVTAPYDNTATLRNSWSWGINNSGGYCGSMTVTQGLLNSSVPDGTGAIGFVLNTLNTFTSPTSRLEQWNNNGVPKAAISLNGTFITAQGGDSIAGDQTINYGAGTFVLDATHASANITNSVCASGSIVLCQTASNDATCKSVSCVVNPSGGSFQCFGNATPTGTTKVSFYVFNGA